MGSKTGERRYSLVIVMPANVQRAKDFLLTTDFPLDKVTFLRTGSVTLNNTPGTSTSSFSINHGLPFTPLVMGNWSLSSDFSTTYEYNSGPFPYTGAGPGIFSRVLAFGPPFATPVGGANSTNILVNYINTSSAVTAYYRMYAFMPDGLADLDVASTAAASDDFIINTDYNYTKLYMSGTIPVPSLPNSFTINHNLGYRPQVNVWMRDISDNRTYPLEFQINDAIYPPPSLEITVSVTTSAVVIYLPSTADVSDVYYRIYLDES